MIANARIATEPPDNVVLLCTQCRGREWEVRGDCVLECVLCHDTLDMVDLVWQHQTGVGLWMNTAH